MKANAFGNINCCCPLKCTEKSKCRSQKQEHATYWGLRSWEAHTPYLVRSVHNGPKKRSYGTTNKRQFCRLFYLCDTNNSKKVRVCRTAYMDTIAFDSARIPRALKKQQGGSLSNKRGKHTPKNKLPDEDLEYAREFIMLFPQYESYYTRSHSEKKYLKLDLNLSLMNRVYVEHCDGKGRKPISITMFTGIFNGLNLYSIHRQRTPVMYVTHWTSRSRTSTQSLSLTLPYCKMSRGRKNCT